MSSARPDGRLVRPKWLQREFARADCECSRWHGFSDGELKTFLTGLAYVNHSASGPLRVEIIAEFELRKAALGVPDANPQEDSL